MINSSDLSTLFDGHRRDAHGKLPHLVRRLILASCSDVQLLQFEMPAGDDVRLPGWDGRVTFTGTHPYVPTGASVWEMGASAPPRTKAEEDFEKRTTDPRGVRPTETTFVFVSPHVWQGRETWAADKKAAGAWKDVRVIDGSILAVWLERVPGVAVWIADELGRTVSGISSLERYWSNMVALRYSRTITPDLIVGGRTDAAESLVRFLQSPAEGIAVVAETAEEAALFAAAVCKQAYTAEQRPRLFMLSDGASTEHLATLSEDHVAILTDPSLYPIVGSAALSHLRFVIPEKRHARTSKTMTSIDIGTIRRSVVASSLEGMGWTSEQADRTARESKGSLHAVLWMLAQPDRGALDWASGRAAAELAPLVLAGQWVVDDHPDHDVLGELAQRDYQELKQTIAEWSGPGRPLDRRGALWDWKAWSFAWTRLAPSLQRGDVERFFKIAEQVLGAADPALELPPDERWLAGIRGKVHRHSAALREGLAQSLVLLAVNGELLPGIDGQGAVNRFVESLLQVTEPARRWISIARWLPDLAEAAPDAFLDSLDRLTGDVAAAKALFTEGGMFSSSPHVRLLWALERLAWSPDHVGRVVLALGRLAEADPGGTLRNRPSHTLRMLLLPWHRTTGASGADRMAALRLLLDNTEMVGWRCAVSLLPQSSDIGDSFARPRWRDWAQGADAPVTLYEYWCFQEELVGLLLMRAGRDGERWAALLKAAPLICKQHEELGNRILQAIRDLEIADLGRTGALALSEAARSLVAHHENAADSDWAMKGELLDQFRALREQLQPRLTKDRNRWLFEQWPDVLRASGLAMQARHDRLAEMRASAVAAVFDEGGVDALLEWAADVGHPESLGCSITSLRLEGEQERRMVIDGLAEVGTVGSRPALARFAFGYVACRTRNDADVWCQHLVAQSRGQLSEAALALLFQALPCRPDTWARVEAEGDVVRGRYWNEVSMPLLSLEDCELATPNLLAAKRPFKVIDLVAMLVHGIEAQDRSAEYHRRLAALARTMLDVEIDYLSKDELAVATTTSYELDQLLNYLEAHGASRTELAGWEWRWLMFIGDGERQLKALQAELSDDAGLFVDLLKKAYRKSTQNEADDESSEAEIGLAHRAHQLLEAWKRPPCLSTAAQPLSYQQKDEGLGPISPAWAGQIEELALTGWMDRAVDLATEADRLDICWYRIGYQLAYAPARHDGVWPCAEVCRAVERAHNDDLERGLMIGVSNRRGAHLVERDGKQESAMASRFRKWCEGVRAEYPRTGAVLRRLAEQYERQACREVERGHLEEFDH